MAAPGSSYNSLEETTLTEAQIAEIQAACRTPRTPRFEDAETPGRTPRTSPQGSDSGTTGSYRRQLTPKLHAANAPNDHDVSLTVYDEMTYKPEAVLDWGNMFSTNSRTIWNSKNLWKNMTMLLCMAFGVALVIILLLPDPASLKINIFYQLSKFLNFACGLMLGFFLTASVKRWHVCTEGFLELCDSIRNLQMQLLAMAVPKERIDLCIRYGLLSGWLLMKHLEAELNNPGKGMSDDVWQEFITDESTARDYHVQLGCHPQLLPHEAPAVRSTKDAAAAMWTWISSLLGRMAEDGQIPGMPTPTYGRIMNLVQDAHNGIRHVRSSVAIRTPFVYVQMLASIVHINNVMNAITLGIVMGISVSGFMIRRGYHYFKPRVSGNQVERDIQFMMITAFICCLGPLLFQALIEISMCLAQPFATKYGKIPIGRLLLMLEEDLNDGEMVARRVPKWERPAFSRAPWPPPAPAEKP